MGGLDPISDTVPRGHCEVAETAGPQQIQQAANEVTDLRVLHEQLHDCVQDLGELTPGHELDRILLMRRMIGVLLDANGWACHGLAKGQRLSALALFGHQQAGDPVWQAQADHPRQTHIRVEALKHARVRGIAGLFECLFHNHGGRTEALVAGDLDHAVKIALAEGDVLDLGDHVCLVLRGNAENPARDQLLHGAPCLLAMRAQLIPPHVPPAHQGALIGLDRLPVG